MNATVGVWWGRRRGPVCGSQTQTYRGPTEIRLLWRETHLWTWGMQRATIGDVLETLFHIFSHVPDDRSIFEARAVATAWRQHIDVKTASASPHWRDMVVLRCAVPSSRPQIVECKFAAGAPDWRKAFRLSVGPLVGFSALLKDENRVVSREQVMEVLHWFGGLAEFAAVELLVPFSHLFSVKARGYAFALLFKASSAKPPHNHNLAVQDWWPGAVERLCLAVARRMREASEAHKQQACASVRQFVIKMARIPLRKPVPDADKQVEPNVRQLYAELGVPLPSDELLT